MTQEKNTELAIDRLSSAYDDLMNFRIDVDQFAAAARVHLPVLLEAASEHLEELRGQK